MSWLSNTNVLNDPCLRTVHYWQGLSFRETIALESIAITWNVFVSHLSLTI